MFSYIRDDGDVRRLWPILFPAVSGPFRNAMHGALMAGQVQPLQDGTVFASIGSGGMSEDVRWGMSWHDNAPVTVKTGDQEMCENEARMLTHVEERVPGLAPHLRRIESLGDRHAVIYDYVDGVPLASVLKHWRIPHIRFALAVALDVGRELDRLHQEGETLHNDVKPANILWDVHRRRWRLLDYGLAGKRKLHDDRLAGTPTYAPPEQTLEGVHTTSGDVYALATMTAEMIAGLVPHQAQQIMDVINAKRDAPAPDVYVHILRDRAPSTFVDFLLSCMHPRRSRRPTTKAFLRHIHRLLWQIAPEELVQRTLLPEDGESEDPVERYRYSGFDNPTGFMLDPIEVAEAWKGEYPSEYRPTYFVAPSPADGRTPFSLFETPPPPAEEPPVAVPGQQPTKRDKALVDPIHFANTRRDLLV